MFTGENAVQSKLLYRGYRLEVRCAPSGWRVGIYPRSTDLPILSRCEVITVDPRGVDDGQASCRRRDFLLGPLPRLREQAHQLRVFRDDFGLARFRPDVARPFFVAGFVALRVELFVDFVTAFRFGVDFDFFAAAFAGARFFEGDVFAFVLRLVRF